MAARSAWRANRAGAAGFMVLRSAGAWAEVAAAVVKGSEAVSPTPV